MRPPVSMLVAAPLQQPSSLALHLQQPSTLLLSMQPSLLSPETTLAPLNAASEPWIRSLVWTDFRVAVALFVVVPFGLLAASVAARVPRTPDDRSKSAETVLRLMTSYWQASSLLLLTVALNIQEANLGVFCGLAAQAMIVVSLWWWSDLNEELDDDDAPLSRAFRAWRLPTSVAAAAGVVVQLPFQGCVGAESLAGDAFCAPWLEPPKFAAGLVGLDASPALGSVANIGCLLYFAVLSYYATVLLPTVGRSGRAARPTLMNFTPIGAWRALGFISDDAIAPTAPPAVGSAELAAPLDRFRSLMGTLYGIAGIAHAADCLIGTSALLTAAGAPPFQELPLPGQALAGLWCLAGPLAYLTSRSGGRVADAGLVAYGLVEVLGAALISANVDAAELAALPNALAVQGVVAASWIYSSMQTDKS
ncbi:unnamed protein product [Pelagomonas calceolata]|uniref:Uncharacterized protein n=1 Tax=Pelagomonas calceolata TaxID=35677 RepID=A0A8J2SY20_9STRA|nr:unnamed protein product [Pelagomonas calceolata]